MPDRYVANNLGVIVTAGGEGRLRLTGTPLSSWSIRMDRTMAIIQR